MLHLNDLALRRGAKLLFSAVNAQIHPGQKVGVSGANGTGKSSLFALIRGELHADAGECRLPPDWVIGHVAQETPSGDCSAVEYVLDGDSQLREIESRLVVAEQSADGSELARLYAVMETIDGYTAQSRAAQLLDGLGFEPQQNDQPVSSFSGGWRMRLNLGRALMCRSDLLLLDEPTNHLDLDAIVWLEQWLRQYSGTLLLISHDRDFLDRIATHILNIERQAATLYRGNYSSFERRRAEQLANQQAQYQRQQREIKHIQSYVDRFRYKASKARQAQSRLKALEKMTLIVSAHIDSPFHFSLLPPAKSPPTLLKIDDCAVGYGRVPVLQGVKLGLAPGDRIGLLGANGAGKSTFIKLLAGELAPISGLRIATKDLNIGYFAQSQLDQLHMEQTPIEHLMRIDNAAREQSLRNYLGGFGFSGDQATSPVAPFSGGEKSRLVLALLVYQRPNLLLLDEPTNHLDLEMRQALANALQEFAGAMVLVSHDRHLLRVSCDRLLLVDAGSVGEYDQSLDDYARWLGKRKQVPVAGEDAAGGSAKVSVANKKQKRQEGAEFRKLLRPLSQSVKSAEAEMDRLHDEQKAVEQALGDAALYEESQTARLKELLMQKARIDRSLSETEKAWLHASERLEAERKKCGTSL